MDTKVERDESLVDARKSAVMTMRWLFQTWSAAARSGFRQYIFQCCIHTHFPGLERLSPDIVALSSLTIFMQQLKSLLFSVLSIPVPDSMTLSFLLCWQ